MITMHQDGVHGTVITLKPPVHAGYYAVGGRAGRRACGLAQGCVCAAAVAEPARFYGSVASVYDALAECVSL